MTASRQRNHWQDRFSPTIQRYHCHWRHSPLKRHKSPFA